MGRPSSSTDATERPEHRYRLYVSAASPVSSRAIVNARRFFEETLPGRHRLEVLNIADHVASARADRIVASPTLLRLAPLPQRRFIGDLSDTAQLARSLKSLTDGITEGIGAVADGGVDR